LLAVYTGESVSNLTQVASDANYNGLGTSLLTFPATASTDYRIAVDGYNGAEGSIVLSISEWNVGSSGYLFMSELQSGTIIKFTPGGIQSTFASGLNHPVSLAFNSAGNLFEADYWSGNVFQFTTNGAQSTFASLADPFVLAFDSSNNLFVASTSTIIKITPGRVQSLFASGLNGPSSMAFDRAGNLFVGNFSGTIIKITPSGVTNTFATGFNPRDGLALAFNSVGNLFVGELDNNTSYGNITEITPGGVQSAFESGLLFFPQALAFNISGDLFVAGYDTGNIYEITPDGTVSTFASGFGNGNPVALAFQGETLPVQPAPTISIQKGNRSRVGHY